MLGDQPQRNAQEVPNWTLSQLQQQIQQQLRQSQQQQQNPPKYPHNNQLCQPPQLQDLRQPHEGSIPSFPYSTPMSQGLLNDQRQPQGLLKAAEQLLPQQHRQQQQTTSSTKQELFERQQMEWMQQMQQSQQKAVNDQILDIFNQPCAPAPQTMGMKPPPPLQQQQMTSNVKKVRESRRVEPPMDEWAQNNGE